MTLRGRRSFWKNEKVVMFFGCNLLNHSCLMFGSGIVRLYRNRYLFQIEYEQLDNKEVKECLGKLENHQELVYIT